MQTFYRSVCADALGLKPEDVTYHNTYLGGGFGRRAVPNADYIVDAVHAAKGEPWPVMTLWAREDDIRMGNYRPMHMNKVRVALDEHGDITAFESKLVGQSILSGTLLSGFIKDGIDPFMVEGLATHHYDIQNNDIQIYTVELPVVPLWMRSVGHTHTAPVVECIIDEAAHVAGKDPIEYRINLLTGRRMARVIHGAHHDNGEPSNSNDYLGFRLASALEDVARISGWNERSKEANVGYGVAVVESFKSIVAQVAKVRVHGNQFQVEKVWCSVDCGFAFNPLNVENQMMSAIHFGLGPVKFSALSIKDGMVEQSNFHDYMVARMSDAPDVEVSIINSGANPGGIGEVGTPPILAAVGNAIFDATGKRYRSHPYQMS
jgi:isoquinoline 1-oxidoreductase beta subunit